MVGALVPPGAVTVTVTCPGVAAAGTVAVSPSPVPLTVTLVAVVEPKWTVVFPALNPEPLMVTVPPPARTP